MNPFLANLPPSDPFFKLNDFGNIIPLENQGMKIPSYNKVILDEVVKNVRADLAENLVAIYFRGSRLTNTYRSDFDIVIVTNTKTHIDIAKRLYSRIGNRFYNIIHYDTLLISRKQLLEDRSLQFVVRVLSVYIFGEPIHIQIDDFTVGKDMVFFIPKLKNKISMVRDLFDTKLNRIDKKKLVNHIIKIILRSCFELVIEKEKRYTRDLPTCIEVFRIYYPQMFESVNKIYDFYDKIINDDQQADFLSNADKMISFIETEYSNNNLKSL